MWWSDQLRLYNGQSPHPVTVISVGIGCVLVVPIDFFPVTFLASSLSCRTRFEFTIEPVTSPVKYLITEIVITEYLSNVNHYISHFSHFFR